MEDRIKELETLIRNASSAYYDGEPIISDQEFDALTRELKKLDPSNSILSSVGFDSASMNHHNDTLIPIEIKVSLPKYQFVDTDSINKWIKSSNLNQIFCLSPKLDGMSIIVTYKNNVLQSAITRGDGKKGMNVTNKLCNVCLPKFITNEKTAEKEFTIRGELLITYPTFNEHLSNVYANPRNAVSGIVNSDDATYKKYLTFVPHPQYNYLISHKDFNVVDTDLWYESYNHLQQYYDSLHAEDFIYPVDGVVIDKYEMNPETKQYDKLIDSIAVKFPTESVETTVKSVDWRLSDRGRLIPVITFDPVDLYGTVVTKASAYHYEYVLIHSLGPGAVVSITKANEIIPHITSVIKQASVPQLPSVEFYTKGVHAFVKESYADTRAKFFKNLVNNKLSFVGFQGAMLTKVLKKLEVTNLETLLQYINMAKTNPARLNHLLNNELNAQRRQQFIDKLAGFNICITDFLSTIKLDGVGVSVTKAFKEIDNSLRLYRYLTETDSVLDFDTFRGVPSNVINMMKNPVIRKIIMDMFKILHINNLIDFSTKTQEVDNRVQVCLSGSFPIKKKEVAERFPEFNFVDSITKDTTMLVIPDASWTSSKVAKATKLGIDILTFDQFINEYEGK